MTDLEQTLREFGGAPAHAPGFEQRLWAGVDAVDAEGAAGAVSGATATTASVARRTRRSSRRWLLVAAVVAVAALGVVALASRHTVQQLTHPPVASAAEIVANVRKALSTFTSVRATIISLQGNVTGPGKLAPGMTSADWFKQAHVDGPAVVLGLPDNIIATADGRLRKTAPLDGGSWRMTVQPDGSVKVEHESVQLNVEGNAPPVAVETHDETTGVMGSYAPGYTVVGGGFGAEQALLTTQTPLGPPDTQGEGASWMGTEGLPVSALSTLADGTVQATTYEGRPALVVSAKVVPGPVVQASDGGLMSYGQFDGLRITVDRATWFPVCFTTLLHGDVVQEERLTRLHLNVPVTEAQFRPKFPKGARVRIVREHFRRASQAQAASAFGYVPLAPAVLPAGFTYSQAAVARTAQFFVMTGAGGAANEHWIPSHDITQLLYRSGFLTMTVTCRLETGMHDPLLADPFASDPSQGGAPNARETVGIHGGALDGVTAKLAIPPAGVPHLWAFHDGLMITVAGDLTRQQLLEVAGSLRPMR
jgi:hypothetical protein